MYELLSRVHSPADLKGLTRDQLKQVANELRQAIIDNLSKTGGHFASDLGADRSYSRAPHRLFRAERQDHLGYRPSVLRA